MLNFCICNNFNKISKPLKRQAFKGYFMLIYEKKEELTVVQLKYIL